MAKLLIFSDAGKDQDDELMFLLGTQLYRQGMLQILAVVANLAPAPMRARLIKGQLNELAVHVPVGVGSDCGVGLDGHDHEFVDVPYLSGPDGFADGAELAVRTLSDADDGSVTLLLVSGLTDAANLIRDHADLVVAKVKEVVFMGGVEHCADALLTDARGFVLPDTAANNNFDPESAAYVHCRLQELGVPMVIVTRQASYACKVPRATYDLMEATGHPVGVKLNVASKRLADAFWQVVSLPAGHPGRGKLPARWTRQWYVNAFCDGQGLERSPSEPISDLVRHAVFSDPMALVAAIPALRERFYEPALHMVDGVEHRVIGVSPRVSGVKHRAELVAFMAEQVVACLKGRYLPAS